MRLRLTFGSLAIALCVVLHAQVPRPEPIVKPSGTPGRELARGQTVLLATFGWDIETDKQTGFGPSGPDVWWEQVRAGVQNLAPRGPFVRLAKVTDPTDFEKLTFETASALPYSSDAIPNSFLLPGAMVAVITTEGNHAKLKVIGYRDSHDFSFESAKILAPDLRDRMTARPNIPKSHLEVSWVLWEK